MTLESESKLRFMDAGRDSNCAYCKGGAVDAGAAIAGHYGILWGHMACVIGAWQEGKLILSSNNVERRPMELELCANRRYDHGKHRCKVLSAVEKHARGSGMLEEMAEQESLQRQMKKERITIMKQDHDDYEPPKKKPVRKKVGRRASSLMNQVDRQLSKKKLPSSETQLVPPASCCHFPAQLIQIVTMPQTMRPKAYVIEEFTAEPETLQEILERIWKKYLEERFQEHKRAQRHLPVCPFHQWTPGEDLEVVTVDLEPDGFKWKRALWWRCVGTNPGEEES